MVGKVASVDVRLLAAVTGGLVGVNVTALCADFGISSKTFYKWRARYLAEGLAGLEPRSRRPHTSPRALPVRVEDQIVLWRKQLEGEGLDHGPATIRWHLEQAGTDPLPSEATIWRVLTRRGFVTPSPKKRPQASLRRFEAAAPNELWQIDGTGWVLADGTAVTVINVIDDYSRLILASYAAPAETCQTAWKAFSLAVSRYGPPLGCLSDNGLAFSGRLRGFEVDFEVKLRQERIRPITSRPHHPQTTGKVERFNQTLKRWLKARPKADTLTQLQTQLDTFTDHYNRQRPHRGIGRQTPWTRFAATPHCQLAPNPSPAPTRQTQTVVSPTGTAQLHQWHIGLGTGHAGQPATVITDGTWACVFIDGQLVRHLQLDPTRRYQPTGKPTGRPPQQPHT
jgi:transposase InsO family protein